MPASIPKGRIDGVVVSLDGAVDGFAEPKGKDLPHKASGRIYDETCREECPK